MCVAAWHVPCPLPHTVGDSTAEWATLCSNRTVSETERPATPKVRSHTHKAYTIQYPVPRPGLDPTHTHTHTLASSVLSHQACPGNCWNRLEESKCSDNSFQQLQLVSLQHTKAGKPFKRETSAVAVGGFIPPPSIPPVGNGRPVRTLPRVEMVCIGFVCSFSAML